MNSTNPNPVELDVTREAYYGVLRRLSRLMQRFQLESLRVSAHRRAAYLALSHEQVSIRFIYFGRKWSIFLLDLRIR